MPEMFAHLRPEEHEYDRCCAFITNVRHPLLLQDFPHHPGFAGLFVSRVFYVLDQRLVNSFPPAIQALGCKFRLRKQEHLPRFFCKVNHQLCQLRLNLIYDVVKYRSCRRVDQELRAKVHERKVTGRC